MLQVPYGDTYATHRRQHLLDMLTSGKTPASKEHFKEAYFVSNALPGSQNRTTPEDTGALSRLGVRLLACLLAQYGLFWKVERLACQIIVQWAQSLRVLSHFPPKRSKFGLGSFSHRQITSLPS